MARSLRDFLSMVQDQHPEHLVVVDRPIDSNGFEISALIHKLEQQRGAAPAFLFRNLEAVDGSPSRYPLLYNLFGSRQLCALALGLEPDQWRMELVHRFAELEKLQGEVVVVDAHEAPCKEHVETGNCDIRQFPVPMSHEKDVGHYFTMACIMKSEEGGGFYDSTVTKNMIVGPDRMTISASPHHHLARIIREQEAKQARTKVIVVLGHHPAFYLATTALTPYGNDDYKTIAAFMGGEPLRLTPSTTWGEEFLVPADAEIIIEGEISPGEREWHNPYGEVSGHYQPRMQAPLIRVTAITRRHDAIMQGINPGHADHWNLGGVPKEGSIINAIRRVVPDVKAVHLPLSGCARFSCYISLKKQFFSDPNKAGMVAFAEMPNLKWAVIVDEEIDVFNEREVLWVLATQVWWERDLQIIDRIQSFREWLGSSVAIVDATRPDKDDFPEPNRVPQEVLSRLDVQAFLAEAQAAERL